MDYRLLVGMHEYEGEEAPAIDIETDVYARPSAGDDRVLYFIGIVDVLTRYNLKKKAAHQAKTAKHGTVRLSGTGCAKIGDIYVLGNAPLSLLVCLQPIAGWLLTPGASLSRKLKFPRLTRSNMQSGFWTLCRPLPPKASWLPTQYSAATFRKVLFLCLRVSFSFFLPFWAWRYSAEVAVPLWLFSVRRMAVSAKPFSCRCPEIGL